MIVEADHHDGVLVAKVEGRVDSSNSQDLQRQLQAAIGDDVGAVVMDLGQLAYISSAGLRVVLLVARTLGQRNVSISLCSLTAPAAGRGDEPGLPALTSKGARWKPSRTIRVRPAK